MNVQFIIAFYFVGYCAAGRTLTSGDLGDIFLKHARNEITDHDYKIMKDVLRLYGFIWDSVETGTKSRPGPIQIGGLCRLSLLNVSDNKRDRRLNVLSKILGLSDPEIVKATRCFVCRSAFRALFVLVNAGVSDETLVKMGTKLCSFAMSARVCHGVMKLNLPILKYIINNTPEATPKTFCGLWYQSYQNSDTCAYDDPRFEWKIKLPPKVKVQRGRPIYFDSPPLTVAVLSDIHVDPFYEPFGVADCDEPVCCRIGQKPRNRDDWGDWGINELVMQDTTFENGDEILLNIDVVSRIIRRYNIYNNERRLTSAKKSIPAGYWGDYRNCDTPIWAYVDVVKQIASNKEVDVVYYIGDNIDHHVWETTYDLNDDVNSFIVDTMKNTFRKNVLVVPTIGNQESQPLNLFAPSSVKEEGLNTTWLYRSLARKWSYYLSRSASKSMKQRGGFSLLIRPGLRVISINNNVAYKLNWCLVYDPLNPKRCLEWLVEELFKAELSGEKVHILSHIPPGDEDLIYTWTREYHRTVDRFSSTITAQFNGHLHSDEFKIFYRDDVAFNVAWNAGSATTYQNFNLNYKIVTFDYTNFEPTSITNYIYNLTEANLTPKRFPRWYKLYEMKKSFKLIDLTASSMDKLVHKMVTNKKHLLDKYVTFTSKNSDAMPYCNTNCKLEMLCNAVTSVLWHRSKCEELIESYFS